MLYGQVSQSPHRADDVKHGLCGMGLQQRNMLIGRRMENDLRPILAKEMPQALFVENVGRANSDRHGRRRGPKLALEKKLACFILIHEHDALRRKTQQLPADFRADAPRTTGNHDYAAVDPAADFPKIQQHRIALKQVFDRNGPRLSRSWNR